MLATHILRTVLYFDVFAWPLTRAELVRYVAPADERGVGKAIDGLVADGKLIERGKHLIVPGRDAVIERRRVGALHAERLWPAAQRAAAVLARVPFVRGVLITGSLSKGAGAADSDVDFFLICAPGRVWITKTFLQSARFTVLNPLREYFCTNYLIAEDALVIDDKNHYTAIELATAIPMYNGALCAQLLEANRPWASRFVPGWDFAVQRAVNSAPLPAQRVTRVVESLVPQPQALDRRAQALWSAVWNGRYRHLDEATRNQRFKRRPGLATNHLKDYQFDVLDQFASRLSLHGLSLDPEAAAEPLCAD